MRKIETKCPICGEELTKIESTRVYYLVKKGIENFDTGKEVVFGSCTNHKPDRTNIGIAYIDGKPFVCFGNADGWKPWNGKEIVRFT